MFSASVSGWDGMRLIRDDSRVRTDSSDLCASQGRIPLAQASPDSRRLKPGMPTDSTDDGGLGNLAGWRTCHRLGEWTHGAVHSRILDCTNIFRATGFADCTDCIAVADVTFGI